MGPEAVDRLWAGLAPSAVAALVGQVPVGADSPAMRELAGRLLAAPMPAEARRPEVRGGWPPGPPDWRNWGWSRRWRPWPSATAASSKPGGGAAAGARPADRAVTSAAPARWSIGSPRTPTAAVAASPTDWRPLALLCALEAGGRRSRQAWWRFWPTPRRCPIAATLGRRPWRLSPGRPDKRGGGPAGRCLGGCWGGPIRCWSLSWPTPARPSRTPS